MICIQQIQINNVIFGFRIDTSENNWLNYIMLMVKYIELSIYIYIYVTFGVFAVPPHSFDGVIE